MKKLTIKILKFCLLPVIVCMLCFFIPTPRIFNYHYIKDDCYNHGSWIYDRIARNNMPIDVAFIGSSHTIHAFNEPTVEKKLIGMHVANFGYCRMGRNLQYVFLKDILKYKYPKLVIIEITEEETKNSHDIFPYLADNTDLFVSKSAINRDFFSDLYHGFVTRFDAVKQTYIFRKKYPKPDTANYGYGPSDRIAPVEELNSNSAGWEKRKNRNSNAMLKNIQLKYPKAYLEAMTKLLDEKDIPFCFVYLREYDSKLELPIDAIYYESIAPLLLPPESLYASPELWMDGSHLNDRGAEICSEWMAGKIADLISECIGQQ